MPRVLLSNYGLIFSPIPPLQSSGVFSSIERLNPTKHDPLSFFIFFSITEAIQALFV